MRHYIGIDLGTTNSAVCSFDGREARIWKSPEQADVTPSAIYIDGKGHRFYGRKAFTMASHHEENAAMLFKRYMGTGKVFTFAASGISMTPVECSAELLRVLYGYLPEEIRSDPETVTVITVPSAFNQMKKDATLEAAELAGIGQTALMQEPVAAVMSVLKQDAEEKLFLIYDLGGGTFDISVAQHIDGHVSILAQGGREMCGGRDLDRRIYRKKVLPWLKERFVLPDDPDADPVFLEMKRTALFAVEEAKIALSASESPVDLWIGEEEFRAKDLNGTEMYLDLTISRDDLADVIEEMAEETSALARETMLCAGVTSAQVDQIIFIGGPTMYAPLREQVCRKLEIEKGVAVNPMTAVAEGAAVYAEMIDWENPLHRRKTDIAELTDQQPALTGTQTGRQKGDEAGEAEPDARKDAEAGEPADRMPRAAVRYENRTAKRQGKIAVILPEGESGDVRIFSQEKDTDPKSDGYDSGRVHVKDRAILHVPLPQPGTWRFCLEVFRTEEAEPFLKQLLEITRTLAVVDAIPASYSIAVKALDKPGGIPLPVYLVRANEPLPKSGSVTFRAAEQLVGGSSGALSFSLWEGEIADPVDDNRYIGSYRIPGAAVSGGTIPAGAEIVCDYEMNEAGNLRLGVSVPCIGLRMQDRNFYSRAEGQIDLNDTHTIVEEVNKLLIRTAGMKRGIIDRELDEIRRVLMEIRTAVSHTADQETVAEEQSRLTDCIRRVAGLQQRYANVIRSRDLKQAADEFKLEADRATESEKAAFDNLVELAKYSIDMGSSDFDAQLESMKQIISGIRWRRDDVVIGTFLVLSASSAGYTDKAVFDRLTAEGNTCLENKDMDGLRRVIHKLAEIRKDEVEMNPEQMLADVNIYKY
ncbi:MAG: Hsp70 family protein [Eubacterium sp.]|nr:Hsp70 family protein [Eubacterium sp.]